MSGEKGKVRLSLEVSNELNQTLERLAEKIDGTKSDVLRRAIALMELAVDAKEKKQSLGVVDQDDKLVVRVVGI